MCYIHEGVREKRDTKKDFFLKKNVGDVYIGKLGCDICMGGEREKRHTSGW